MRVAFVGVGYFPRLTAGDKNFFFRLLPRLRERLDEVVVLSLNDQDDERSTQECPAGDIAVYNFKRALHFGDPGRFRGEVNGLLYYHHKHGPARELSEKLLTLVFNSSRIKSIFDSHGIQAVHFMDNFGFGMRYIRRVTGARTSFAAANYEPKGGLYNRMQAAFIKGLDGVITYSGAYRDILAGLGYPRERMSVIHWGVDIERFRPLDAGERAAVRRSAGLSADRPVALWSGYIQQIRQDDFYRTVDIARRLAAKGSRVEFVFCFKPEVFRPEYKDLAGPGVRVITGADNFRPLLGASDFLLSPVGKLHSTLSPPLTWVEAMAMGVPVLTTRALGADEIIDDGVNGFLTDSYDTLAEAISAIEAGGIGDEMRSKAREKVLAYYDLEKIAGQYAKFWKTMT